MHSLQDVKLSQFLQLYGHERQTEDEDEFGFIK